MKLEIHDHRNAAKVIAAATLTDVKADPTGLKIAGEEVGPVDGWPVVMRAENFGTGWTCQGRKDENW